MSQPEETHLERARALLNKELTSEQYLALLDDAGIPYEIKEIETHTRLDMNSGMTKTKTYGIMVEGERVIGFQKSIPPWED